MDINEALGVLEEAGYIALLWHLDDVLETAKDMGIEIDISEAKKILFSLKHHHDCVYGVTWEHVQYEIDSFVEDRNK